MAGFFPGGGRDHGWRFCSSAIHGKGVNMRRRTGTFLLLVTFAALALTGCIKTKVSMEIKSDGSGSVTTLIGFPAAMISLATEAAPGPGQGHMQELEQMVKDQLGEDVSFRRCTDGA